MTAVSSYMMFMKFMSLIITNDDRGFFHGKTSPQCANHYFRMFVEKYELPRNFLFWHEVDDPENALSFRIIGGKQIPIEEAPYTVMYGAWCGGTLLSPDWVLTAAHCKNRFTFVSVGSTYLSNGIKHDICAHYIHPGYYSKNKQHKFDYDYQLLLLETPVMISNRVRPIAIGSDDFLYPDSLITISGWGHSKYKDSSMQENLQRVQLPVVNQTHCSLIPMRQYKNLTARMFCAGYSSGLKDACQGDSGAPVIQKKMLVGLVSFGVGCALPELPGVYALVTHAKDWIREVTVLSYL